MQRINLVRLLAKFFVLITLAFFLGCSTSTNYKSSVVHFLYSDGKEAVKSPQDSILSLPVKVGIAFIPEIRQNQGHNGQVILPSLSGLSEQDKMSLMQEIGGHFSKQEFVKSVVQIPSAYVASMGSFDNLDRLSTNFGVDVIVLISFNQLQFVDKGPLSVGYLTIVGALIVPGEINSTHTILDAVCYHIPSRKMIFGASGSSNVKSRSTPLSIVSQAKKDSIKGFCEANKYLVSNLDTQMDSFKAMICNPSGIFQIVCAPGYTGIGSINKGAVCSVQPLKADKVLVKKSERKLYLKKGDQVFKEYKISLGANPVGHKMQEGDQRTPEGTYILDWRKVNSRFYKSIHISYPNRNDVTAARSKGVSPGGMIMIHGVPNYYSWTKWYFLNHDWTDGCIAVSNPEMDEIWAHVSDGTIIEIQP